MNRKQICVLLLIILVGAVPVGAVLAIAYTRTKGNNDNVWHQYIRVFADQYRGEPTNWYTIEELIKKYRVFSMTQYFDMPLLVELYIPTELQNKIYEDQPIFQLNGFHQVVEEVSELPNHADIGVLADIYRGPLPPTNYTLYTLEDFVKTYDVHEISLYDYDESYKITSLGIGFSEISKTFENQPIFQYNGELYQVTIPECLRRLPRRLAIPE